MPDRLSVAIDGRSVGEIALVSGKFSFAYAGDSPQRLSVAMPTTEPVHGPKAADPWFHGLLPDSADVRARWARAAGVSARSSWQLSAHYGHDLAGALTIGHSPGTDSVSEPVSEEQIGAWLAAANADPDRWPAQRWSLGGAQAKIALARTPTGWATTTAEQPSTHIIKPGIPAFEHQAVNEHLCLSALRRLGYPAARTAIAEFGGVPAIVVDRYDRAVIDGRLVRIHQEDLCQALGIYPWNKYPGDGGPTAPQIADLLAAYTSPAQVFRFARALVLNYLLGAPDAHAKNYSLIHADNIIRLAPLYDVASIFPYADTESGLTRTAMSVGGRNRFGEVRLRHIGRLAATVQVDPEQLQATAIADAAALPDALADAARSTASSRADWIADSIITNVRAMAAALLR